jgi:hypothetical protein
VDGKHFSLYTLVKVAQKKPSSAKPKKRTVAVPVAKPSAWHPRLVRVAKLFLVPALIYFLFFCFFTWPWIVHFNNRFFTDQGDGFQNVWNMWWVNFSVTHLHQLPWHTTYLHYPYGTTLIAQTLNPFNGFVAIVLLKVFSLIEAFNTMVIFSFVFAGVTAFWLCRFVTKRYIPSLIGGFMFTFSSYHFAHAIGHMQLVSLEWIPLFILLWWKLLTKPRYRTAVGAAVVLLLVLFCDYYYFLYCVSVGVLVLIYLWHKKELAPWREKSTYRPWLVFLVIGACILTPLPLALVRENKRDPLQGAHNDRIFSTDLFSSIIDGGFWRFGVLTKWYWEHIKAYMAESSVSLTLSAALLMVVAIIKRNKLHRDTVFWIVVGAIFGIFSLGPRLMVRGYSINHAPLPYALLERIIPELKLSGDPDRIIVITTLAVAVLSAIVLSNLNLKKRWHQLALVAFVVVFSFEVWPATMPVNIPTVPAYVHALAKLPRAGVVDNGAVSASWQLYDQTVDDQPMVLGYISRTPTSVENEDNILTITILRNQLSVLCSQYGVRWFTTPTSRPLTTNFPIVYRGDGTLIYDLKDSPHC